MIEVIIDKRMGKESKPMKVLNDPKMIVMDDYSTENELSSMEVRKMIEEWTKKSIGEILFDSQENQWKQNNCQLYEKIQNKSNLLMLFDDGKYHYGYYSDIMINEIGKYIDDKKSFLFSINRKQIYPIKQTKYSICIHLVNDEKLLTIGKEDIVLFKEEKKDQCYCKQVSFEYNRQQGMLNGKEGKNNPFVIKRFVIFQLN